MRRKTRRIGPALTLTLEKGQSAFVGVLALQAIQTAARLALAGALAVLAGHMVADATLNEQALIALFAALLLSAALGYATERKRAWAEADLVDSLRGAIEQRFGQLSLASLSRRPAGEQIFALERHPSQLARLVISHGVASRMLVIGPLMAALSILVVSWEAALTLLAATPVMIVFFVFAGGLIRSHADAQEKALGQLAAQFADRIRAVPTIIAGHALEREHAKLESRMRTYSQATMGVLKVAFLNAGIIDFFSSLSIAILAVFLGLGHLGLIDLPGFSGLHLWQSLFILMIASEYFSPFRRYAEQYHAKAEGAAAAAALDWLFADEDAQPGVTVPAEDVRERVAAALLRPLPDCGLLAVTGPSGSGKSTYLKALAGLEHAGSRAASPLQQISWMSADIFVPAGTLASAIIWNRPKIAMAEVARVARAAGLLDDCHISGGLAARITSGGDNLSGGQRMRLAVARALLGEGPILADEPTAKLDPIAAAAVRQSLVEAARSRLVVVATHDLILAGLASETIDLSPAVSEKMSSAA